MEFRPLIISASLLLGAMPAQEEVRGRASVRMLAAGAGKVSGLPVAESLTSESYREVLDALGWEVERPPVDFEHEVVWLVDLGRGRGGELAITLVAGGAYGLVKIEGAVAAGSVDERWAMLAMKRRAMTRPLVLEVDAGYRGRLPLYREVARWSPDGQGARPEAAPARCASFRPAGRLGKGTCILDVVTSRWFVTEQIAPEDRKAALEWMGGTDFANQVLLVFAHRERADTPALDVLKAAGRQVVRDAGWEGGGKRTRYGILALPRIPGSVVDCEFRTRRPGAGAERVREVERARLGRYPIADVATTDELQVLRVAEAEVEKRTEPLCRLISTHHDWQALRKELSEFEDLPDDWCDFAKCSILVVVAPENHVWPGLHLSVVRAGDVDVLTADQVGPSGVFAGHRTCAMLAVVPARAAPLEVVLRERHGPGPAEQRQLGTFQPRVGAGGAGR